MFDAILWIIEMQLMSPEPPNTTRGTFHSSLCLFALGMFLVFVLFDCRFISYAVAVPFYFSLSYTFVKLMVNYCQYHTDLSFCYIPLKL